MCRRTTRPWFTLRPRRVRRWLLLEQALLWALSSRTIVIGTTEASGLARPRAPLLPDLVLAEAAVVSRPQVEAVPGHRVVEVALPLQAEVVRGHLAVEVAPRRQEAALVLRAVAVEHPVEAPDLRAGVVVDNNGSRTKTAWPVPVLR